MFNSDISDVASDYASMYYPFLSDAWRTLYEKKKAELMEFHKIEPGNGWPDLSEFAKEMANREEEQRQKNWEVLRASGKTEP